jgi:hypothetical protein
VRDGDAEPVFHEYVVAPPAVIVADCPLQIVAFVLVTTGSGFTVTVETAVFEQPFEIPVTVYEVDVEGLTVIGFIVEPLLHE